MTMDFTALLDWGGNLLKALVNPDQGTKFLVAISGIVAIVWMTEKGITEPMPYVLVCALVMLYLISDLIYKIYQLKQPALPVKQPGLPAEE